MREQSILNINQKQVHIMTLGSKCQVYTSSSLGTSHITNYCSFSVWWHCTANHLYTSHGQWLWRPITKQRGTRKAHTHTRLQVINRVTLLVRW